MTIQCPACAGQSRVVETRDKDGMTFRRRKCLACNKRWSTVETITTYVSRRAPTPPEVLDKRFRTPEALAKAVMGRAKNQDVNLARRRAIPLEAVAEYREVLKRGIKAAEAAEIVRNSYQRKRTMRYNANP